jgi:hypothetical protein
MLIKLAETHCQFFCTPGRDWRAYADVRRLGHRETMQIDSDDFKSWLIGEYYAQYGSAPSDEAVKTATRTLWASAKRGGTQHEVHLRRAFVDNCLYLDLGNDAWQVVQVDAHDWRIVVDAPVRFRRPATMLPLPLPERGGKVDDLWQFVSVGPDHDRVLAVAWLLSALAQPAGALPVLLLWGEQGTAKSVATRFMTALVDRAKPDLLALTQDRRDLAVTAHSYYVLAFDNVSTLTADQSDSLCKLATGSGFATRKNYSDGDLAVFQAKRPVILNGIPDFVDRPDLADRALRLELERIDAGTRRTERHLWREFDAKAPQILGALLNVVSVGLANLPTTPEHDTTTRLADFEQWLQACEPALWPDGTFAKALRDNREATITATLEGDPLAAAAMHLAELPDGWNGTATEFLAEAERLAGGGEARRLYKSARFVANRLRQLAPALRAKGITIESRRSGRSGDRMIYLRCAARQP